MGLSNSDFRWISRVFMLLSVSFVQWGPSSWCITLKTQDSGFANECSQQPTQLHREDTEGTCLGGWYFHLAYYLFTIPCPHFPLRVESCLEGITQILHTAFPNLTHSEVGVWAGTQSHWKFWICNRSDRILFCSPNYYIISKSKRLLEELIHKIQLFESVD